MEGGTKWKISTPARDEICFALQITPTPDSHRNKLATLNKASDGLPFTDLTTRF